MEIRSLVLNVDQYGLQNAVATVASSNGVVHKIEMLSPGKYLIVFEAPFKLSFLGGVY